MLMPRTTSELTPSSMTRIDEAGAAPAHPAHRRARFLLHAFAPMLVAVLVLATPTAALTATASEAPMVAVAHASLTRTIAANIDALAAHQQSRIAVAADLDAAAELLASSDGHVLQEQERDQLAAVIADGQARLDRAAGVELAVGDALAAAAATSTTADSGWTPSASGPSVSSVYVSGWVPPGEVAQAALDGGGQWAIDYGVMVGVLAHNWYDATALGLMPGDIVEFSGAVSGRYVVTGEAWVQYGATLGDITWLGTPLFMQTCAFGSDWMRVVGLTPA